MSWQTKIDADLAGRLHAFEVVWKVALQIQTNTLGRTLRKKLGRLTNMIEIGKEEFGLTRDQGRYCMVRAQNWLAEIREAERARNKARLKAHPTPFKVAA